MKNKKREREREGMIINVLKALLQNILIIYLEMMYVARHFCTSKSATLILLSRVNIATLYVSPN